MFERPDSGNTGILVSLDFGQAGYAESLQESRQLALSAGLNLKLVINGKRSKPDPALFAGTGKVA